MSVEPDQMTESAAESPDAEREHARLQRKTRAALAFSVHELHAYTLALLATFGEEDFEPTSDLALSRRVGALFQQYKTMSVITAVVVRGASWAQVAAALGMEEGTARALFGEAVARWCNGDPAPWAPVVQTPAGRAVRARTCGIPVHDLEWIVRELDGYYLRFARGAKDPLARLDGELHPVSGGLPPAV